MRATYPGQLILFVSITLICGEDCTVSPTFLFRPITVFDVIFNTTEIKINSPPPSPQVPLSRDSYYDPRPVFSHVTSPSTRSTNGAGIV